MRCKQTYCRAEQSNKRAKFCWKCGSALSSEKGKKIKRGPKPKQAQRPIRDRQYSHRSPDGMRWRFEGSRPVSALADAVMNQVRKRTKL